MTKQKANFAFHSAMPVSRELRSNPISGEASPTVPRAHRNPPPQPSQGCALDAPYGFGTLWIVFTICETIW
jgi:hypothetical protein